MNAYLGQIDLLAFDYAPPGWMICAGQILPIEEPYTALYSLLGTSYGGNGRNSFGIPDLRGKEPRQGPYYCIRVLPEEGNYPLRS